MKLQFLILCSVFGCWTFILKVWRGRAKERVTHKENAVFKETLCGNSCEIKAYRQLNENKCYVMLTCVFHSLLHN